MKTIQKKIDNITGAIKQAIYEPNHNNSFKRERERGGGGGGGGGGRKSLTVIHL